MTTVIDVVCWDDLDEFGAEITDPLEALRQDNHHRLITPPGQNIDDPDFGLGIDRMLSGDDSELGSLAPRIEAEFRKDPRNKEVQALITPLANPGEFDIAISIVTDEEELLRMDYRATNGVLETVTP